MIFLYNSINNSARGLPRCFWAGSCICCPYVGYSPVFHWFHKLCRPTHCFSIYQHEIRHLLPLWSHLYFQPSRHHYHDICGIAYILLAINHSARATLAIDNRFGQSTTCVQHDTVIFAKSSFLAFGLWQIRSVLE